MNFASGHDTVFVQTGQFFSIKFPTGLLSTSETVIRGVVYAAVLVYFFVGISIIADRFMDSIEVKSYWKNIYI